MSATVPITNGMMAGAQQFQQVGSAAEAPPAAVAPSAVNDHNTNLHVAMILLAMGGLVAFLHLGGWRLAFDVGMGRG